MVFTIPAERVKDKNLFQNFDIKVNVTDTARGATAVNLQSLAPGILCEVGADFSQKSGNANFVLRKGELYVKVYIVKQQAGGSYRVYLVDDYVYEGNSPHWLGEIPLEDGDYMATTFWNSSTTTGLVLFVRGYYVKF